MLPSSAAELLRASVTPPASSGQSIGPSAEQKSPSLCLHKPEDLNRTVEDLASVKDQLKAFVQEQRRREVESSLP